jgi:hypothetical protein
MSQQLFNACKREEKERESKKKDKEFVSSLLFFFEQELCNTNRRTKMKAYGELFNEH